MRSEGIEIMAPVGSYESLMAAIQAGANAVYFGLNKLNMRSRSSANFNEDDLDQIISVCRKYGVRTYLTLNIVVYNNELEQIKKLIDLAIHKKVSAIIASDHAVIAYARSRGMEVHISTQVNISNIESVRFYSQFADVVVLARELNLEQVREIADAVKNENIRGPGGELLKLEMFIHGALCMSVSGKCYLSLHE